MGGRKTTDRTITGTIEYKVQYRYKVWIEQKVWIRPRDGRWEITEDRVGMGTAKEQDEGKTLEERGEAKLEKRCVGKD